MEAEKPRLAEEGMEGRKKITTLAAGLVGTA